jgi:hypothetical protein
VGSRARKPWRRRHMNAQILRVNNVGAAAAAPTISTPQTKSNPSKPPRARALVLRSTTAPACREDHGEEA